MTSVAKGRGKAWESQVGIALKAARAWRYNTNDLNPATDYVGCYKGLSCLIEAKEVHSDLLSFSSISDRERRNLDAHHQAGGLAVVAICRTFPNRRRAWLCAWDDWKHLEVTLGRKSIPLRDGQRPEQLVELPRIERPNGLGTTFDLTPSLNRHLEATARSILREFEVTAVVQAQASKDRVYSPGSPFNLIQQAQDLGRHPLWRAEGRRYARGRVTVRGLRHLHLPDCSPYSASVPGRFR